MNKALRNFCIFLLILGCLAATVLMAILGIAFFQGAERDPRYRGDILSSRTYVSGQYLLINSDEKVLFHIADGVFYPLCNPDSCDESCLFRLNSAYYPANTMIVAAENGRVYFTFYEYDESNYPLKRIAFVNTRTHKVTVLDELSVLESRYSYTTANTFICGDYLYYSVPMLDTSSSQPNAYINTICRIPKDGGKREFLFECANEGLFFVANEKVITVNSYSTQLYSYNIESDKRTMLYDANYISPYVSFYKNKLYFVALKNSKYNLISLDIISGKQTDLAENVSYFSLLPDGDGIYYLAEDRTVLYYCTLAGRDHSEVYSGNHIFNSFTVIKGKLYGYFQMYDERNGSFSSAEDLIVFDPQTGRYEAYKIPILHEYEEDTVGAIPPIDN